mgnify:CR=1 FL=1
MSSADSSAAIVTGASSGIGAAMVRSILDAKLVDVIYAFDLKPPSAEWPPAAVKFVKVDVTDEDAVRRAVMEDVRESLRLVVNSAGILGAHRLVKGTKASATNLQPHPAAVFNRVMNVNVFGTFNVMRFAALKMSTQSPVVDRHGHPERGVIINIASIAAFEGEGGQVAYAASKAAVVGMTLPAARDMSRYGVRVVSICPGLVDTPMAGILPQSAKEFLSKSVPFPKRLAQPSEMGALAVHIAQNKYINGAAIRIDGAIRLSAL